MGQTSIGVLPSELIGVSIGFYIASQGSLYVLWTFSKLYMWWFARFGTICAIYKTWKTIHERVLHLRNLQTSTCKFIKRNNPPLVFFSFYIVQMVPNCSRICHKIKIWVSSSASVAIKPLRWSPGGHVVLR